MPISLQYRYGIALKSSGTAFDTELESANLCRDDKLVEARDLIIVAIAAHENAIAELRLIRLELEHETGRNGRVDRRKP